MWTTDPGVPVVFTDAFWGRLYIYIYTVKVLVQPPY